MKVKRLVSLALALAVVLSTLCGCGKQEQPDEHVPLKATNKGHSYYRSLERSA